MVIQEGPSETGMQENEIKDGKMMQTETRDGLAREYGLAEAVVGMISSPVATMREMSQGSFLRVSLTVFFLVLLPVSLSTALTDTALAAQLGGPAVVFAVLITLSLLIFFTQAGLCFATARLFGARGSFSGLLSLLALANVPSIFMVPYALLRLAPGIIGSVLHGLGSLVLTVWVGILAVIAVRETFQLSTGRALLIYFLPILLLVVLVLMAGLAVIVVSAAT